MVGAAPAENFVPTFGENGGVAFFVRPFGELVVVGEFGVAENSRNYAEKVTDFGNVGVDLVFEFFAVVEKCQRMVKSFADDFDFAGRDHAPNLFDKGIIPFFSLFEPGAGDGKRNFKIAVGAEIFFEQVEHWVITFGRDFFENALVGLTARKSVFKIIGIIADIKNRVFAIANRLVQV